MDLQGAKALVTGGSEGIGKAIAVALKREGADVVITGRRADVLEAAAEEIGVGWSVADVGDEDGAIRTVREFVEQHGRLDILVNNAGFGRFAPLVEMELSDMEEVYRTNVFGAFLMAREAAKVFIRQGSGNLINISSTSGLKGGRGSTAYSSSKFALRGMTECWRDELRRHDVRVMLINPSEVLTDFGSKAGFQQEQSPKKLRGQEIADAIVGALKIDDRGFIPEFSVFATNPF
ncbi:MAG: SDR family NAD(P)-dependent oxidoreductase [marine benthic group bacterium]|nr:SDR family NAD(P)-dependent oxidoreductase [Gemmatimonadota bacterium]MCL7963497.1 SDR family NAD(P)-dependent oxidoreductase [Candidatus Carthagonibacter metallireducens]MCL7967049.1 SDR family NAD(P)-dependent oxidoreductase [Gemmatimonadota bacterium]